MREFEPTLPKGSIQLPENTTTLVIEDVPSDVAWNFITGYGKNLSTEEQKEQLIRMFERRIKDNKEQLKEEDEPTLDNHRHDIFTLERCEQCDQTTTRITTDFQDLKRMHPHFLSFTEQHNFIWKQETIEGVTVEVSECSDCGLTRGYRLNNQFFFNQQDMKTAFPELFRGQKTIPEFEKAHNFVWENTLVGDNIVEVSQCSDCGLINGYRVNDQVFKTEEEMKTAFPELFEVQEETIGHSHSL